MKKHNYSKNDLIRMASERKANEMSQSQKVRKETLHVWGQMGISLAILIDHFDFSPEETREYIDMYDKFCDLYLADKENIIDILKNVEDYADVHLLNKASI